MTALRIIGRVLKAIGIGLGVAGVALLDEEEAGASSAVSGAGSDQDGDAHVMPMYGREHETTVRCWCHPTRDDEEPGLVVHRDMN